MTTFTVTYYDSAKQCSVSYDVPGMSTTELAAAARRYYLPTDMSGLTFERYEELHTEAADFAAFCVAETLAEEGDCDPTRSFKDLFVRYLANTTTNA